MLSRMNRKSLRRTRRQKRLRQVKQRPHMLETLEPRMLLTTAIGLVEEDGSDNLVIEDQSVASVVNDDLRIVANSTEYVITNNIYRSEGFP